MSSSHLLSIWGKKKQQKKNQPTQTISIYMVK